MAQRLTNDEIEKAARRLLVTARGKDSKHVSDEQFEKVVKRQVELARRRLQAV